MEAIMDSDKLAKAGDAMLKVREAEANKGSETKSRRVVYDFDCATKVAGSNLSINQILPKTSVFGAD
jgi:hypothetical protein